MRTLEHITDQVARSAARLQDLRSGNRPRLDDTVAAFHALRPLLFTARDRCLNDSLALVAFLAREGIASRWVIGVRVQPFGAHAWVQVDGLVLNDLHENVRHYEPILVV